MKYMMAVFNMHVTCVFIFFAENRGNASQVDEDIVQMGGKKHQLVVFIVWYNNNVKIDDEYTSSTAQGGGGSFKNRKRIGEIDCCEWRMSKQKHWPTD